MKSISNLVWHGAAVMHIVFKNCFFSLRLLTQSPSEKQQQFGLARCRRDAHPFFKLLAEQTNSAPKWNFHKYLIGRDGEVVDYFATVTGPGSNKVIRKIEELLNKPS